MKIILIGNDGKKIGLLPMNEAKRIAEENESDLHMVDPRNNVYKLIDFGKLKYDEKRKQKQQRANRRAHKVKEIKLRPSTDSNDVKTKLNHAKNFLKKGLKIKITMEFRGRQISLREAGLVKMNDLINTIVNENFCTIESAPKFVGRKLTTILSPK